MTIAGCRQDSSPLAPSAVTPTPSSPTPTTVAAFDVTGTVRSRADGAVIPTARVELTSGPQSADPVATDAQGRYTIAGLVTGSYSVRVSHADFDPIVTSFALTTHRALDVTLTTATTPETPKPEGGDEWKLSGAITTASANAPVADARVVIVEAGDRRREVRTSADGRYDFGPIREGQVVLRVDASGFVASEQTVTLERDMVVNVALSTVAPPPASGPVVSGQAVDVLSRAPIAGVRIQVDGGGEALSGADGTFAVTGTSGTSERVMLSSGSTVDRQTRIDGRADPTLSLIPRTFDLTAFDQMVRSRGSLLRWVEAPRLVLERRVLAFTNTSASAYAATTASMTDAEANALVADLTWALPQLTGGRFTAFASVEIEWSAADASVSVTRPGAIVVARFEGLEQEIATWGYGRWAWNGAGEVNAGAIMLDDAFDASASPHRRSLRAHELGHALGYDHVGTPSSAMHDSARVEPTAFDRDATAIAFSRIPLNRSPDVDPDAATVSRANRTTLQWDGRR